MRDAVGSVQSALVFGGASDIAQATVRSLAAGGRLRRVVLAARKPDALGPFADELRARGVEVDPVEFDADALETHERLVAEVFERHGDLDLVLVSFGVQGEQSRQERDPREAVALLHTNLLGSVSVLLPVADRLRAQGHGDLVVLSSVAAERGRRSNFVYGASKAGLDTFCQGLGDALAGTGVRLMLVRPGFVHTKLTAGRKPAPLSTSADAVAEAIVGGLRRGAEIVWVPAVLRPVMSVLRHLPRPVFRRLDL